MKAFILAGGIGSRLRPLTDNVPKCMVKVGDEMIIDRQIDSLINAGINDIYVCTGYLSEILKEHINKKYNFVKFIYNEDYLETNNMVSMYLAKSEACGENIIVMNSDVFIEPEYIKVLIDSPIENCILTEKGRYEEENMKIIVKNDSIVAISKQISAQECYGTTIDIYKFSKEFTQQWFDVMKDFIENKNEKKLWNEVGINEMFKKFNVKPVNIGNMWFEIDNLDDLENAKKLFNKY